MVKKQTKSEKLIKEVRRNTRQVYNAEQKILIVMEGLRAELSVAELCRKYGISEATYYKWSKEFIEAGKKRLSGNETREATSEEVKDLRRENTVLKESLADLVIRYDIVKKKLKSVGLTPQFKKYMRLTAEEKAEIIEVVKNSELGVNRTLKQLGIHKRTFYNWYHAYSQNGIDGLKAKRNQKQQWNSIPDRIKQMVVEIALQYPQETPRLIATRFIDEQGVFISESSVYRILKKQGLLADTPHRFLAAADQFHSKTNFVHQMWQTDFTYFKIIGWGWYYLSTVIDDYSRYIVHWELCPSMTAQDVKRTIDNAISKAKIKNRKQPPVLLSDNGPCYIAKELKDYLMDTYGIRHIHGKPLHPQTQGKIERYHRSMKNVVKLHHYYAPEQLERAIDKFVQYYNSQRYHEALNNLTPEDVYLGRQDQILKLRKQVKINTLNQRKLNYCFGLI